MISYYSDACIDVGIGICPKRRMLILHDSPPLSTKREKVDCAKIEIMSIDQILRFLKNVFMNVSIHENLYTLNFVVT